MVAYCVDAADAGEQPRPRVRNGAGEPVLYDVEPFDAAPESKAEALQPETNAEDGQQVHRVQVPDVFDNANIGVIFRRTGARADYDGVEGAEEGEQGVDMDEGVDMDDVDGGTGSKREERGEVMGEGVVGVDEEDAVRRGGGGGHRDRDCFGGGGGRRGVNVPWGVISDERMSIP